MAFDERYLNNRLKYHTASRLPKQAGDSLAASFNADGHTVTTKQVWASAAKEFPFQSLGPGGKASVSNDPVGGTTNLIEVFKEGGVSAAFWNGGKVWTNELYPAVKLYEDVPATAVNGADSDWPAGGTSGKTAYFQSFEILASENGVTSGTIRVADWVNPVAVNDPATSSPEAGFTGIFKWNGTTLQDDANWTLDKSNWEFVYTAGLLTFEYNAAPEKVKSKKYSAGDTTLLTITAFKYDGTYLTDVLSGYSTPLAISSEFKNVRELITNVQSEALGIEAGNGIVFGSNISGDTIINVDIADNDKVLSFGETGLSTTISLVKLESAVSGYAASYQLQGLNGTVLGDTINIAKDQFLKGAEITEGAMISGKFTSKSEIEKLPENEQVETEKFIHFTFEINKKDDNGKTSETEENHVYLNIHELIDVYTGGLAIEVTSDNKINLVRSANSEKFFFADSTGAGVSGIQTAIDLAASGIISGVTEIPTTTTGFKYNTLVFTADGETAIVDVVNNKVVDISEENVDKITTTTLSSSLPTVNALTGYVKETTSGILPYIDSNFLKEVEVSGAEALSITEKANNKQTISLAISDQPGNAIVDAASGLFVQKYVAGKNITLSANVSGEMTINGSNDYELPVATDTILGGVKAGDDISVDVNGEVTVLQANKVKHTLTAGSKNFNGLTDIEILASDLSALTGVLSGNGISVTEKDNCHQSISIKIKEGEQYLVVDENGLATTGIGEAITDYVDPRVNFLSSVLSGYDTVSAVINADISLAQAIIQDRNDRVNADNFLSSVLSGYDTVSAVINADMALAERLSDVEGQLGGGSGSGSVTEKIKFLSGVLSGYDTVSAVIDADTTEKAARQAADSYLSGVLCGYTAEGAVKAADDALAGRVSTLETWKTFNFNDPDNSGGLQIVRAETPTPGYAATYKLADSKDGAARGAVINIPKDQFLSGASYNANTKALDLTFAIKTKDANGFETDNGHTVSIPASSFVHEYQAGDGLSFNADTTTFNVVKDNKSENYLYITESGIGISGIQEALNGVTASVENTIIPDINFLSGVLSAYTEEGAVSGAISALDARLDTLEGAETVSGSVQYAVKTRAQFADYTANGTAASGTIQYAIRQNTAAITTLNGDIDTVGSVDYKIDQYDKTISALITEINLLKDEIK